MCRMGSGAIISPNRPFTGDLKGHISEFPQTLTGPRSCWVIIAVSYYGIQHWTLSSPLLELQIFFYHL